VTGIQHIGIPTNDIEKTIAFYCGLGFEVALRTINQSANEQVAFLRLKNLTIETYENHCASNKAGAIDHIALDVSDVEAVFQVVKAGGYSLLDKEIQFLPFWRNGVKFFTIQGPNAEKIEFSQML
jgi:catechol 2,3-dioxygenase-like lactoylglutathione lyase family enzyme